MKKLVSLAVAVLIGIGTISANPVGLNTAKSLGQQFVMANFERNSKEDLSLVYTVTSDRGQACVYVFNVGNSGFVLVAASDNVRPILGYSENGTFDASNPQNGAMYMLETYKNSISYALETNLVATPDIVGEWESLKNCGKLNSRKAKKVGPLVETRWNQDYPYNLYAPQVVGGAPAYAGGGRCYAGCVATAMGQLMRYWNHPITGTGSHSYYCIGYEPTNYDYGTQSANFGATTYQWDLMPLTLDGATQEQCEAVSLLLRHCGVAVDMKYDFDGSGSNSERVPPAMSSYFDYGHCVRHERYMYSLAQWINLLKAEFDLGHPVYYSGAQGTNGHAFVCDGYDENDFMHFNFGWGGVDDDYYAVDAIDYSSGAATITNFVPNYVYQNTLQAPTNVSATRTSDVAQEATISWTNPSKNVGNQTISAIDQIVVTRDDVIIYSVDNPTPGAAMSFVDSNVPGYTVYEYAVYAIKDGTRGLTAKTTESFGPKCNWKIVATATNMSGWKSAYLVAYDAAGREVDRFTMTNSNPVTYNMGLVPGKVSFAWITGTTNVNLSFKIKDPSGAIVYEFTGVSNDVPAGVLYEGSFGCDGATPPTAVPPEIFASSENGFVTLTWEGGDAKDLYGYNVYRDGLLCALAHGNTFVDELAELGGHCYQICYLSDGGESPMSNEVCANAGEGCEPGRELWCDTYTNSQGVTRPWVKWSLPENADGLQAFYFYRKEGADGTYSLLKKLNRNTVAYKEASTLHDGSDYYYMVRAYYKEIDCLAAPIKAIEGNVYCVMYHYDDINAVGESTIGMKLYPNPAKDSFTVEADNLQSVTVYNTIGQMVYRKACEGNSTVIDLADVDDGLYMVKVVTANGESVRKLSIVK